MNYQHIETIVCPVNSSDTFSQAIKTQRGAGKVKRIQVSSPDIGEDGIVGGVCSLKATGGAVHFAKIANSLVWAYPYQKAEERGLSLEFSEVLADGNELLFDGSLVAECSGYLHITIFYE